MTQETQVPSLHQEDPLEKETVTHSDILAWKTHGQSLAGYSPWGHKASATTERLTHSVQGGGSDRILSWLPLVRRLKTTPTFNGDPHHHHHPLRPLSITGGSPACPSGASLSANQYELRGVYLPEDGLLFTARVT